MKSTFPIITVIFFLLLPPLVTLSQAKSTNSGYRIEETSGKDAKGRDARVIKFISPSGGVVKTLTRPYKGGYNYDYTISPSGDYLIIMEDTPNKEYLGVARVRVSSIDVKARTIWSKTLDIDYATTHGDETSLPPYHIVISKDGSRIAFARLRGYHIDQDSVYHEVLLFDRKGSQTAKIERIPAIKMGDHINIAPDGTVVVAELNHNKYALIDMVNNKSKIIQTEKQEDHLNIIWSLACFPLANESVELSGVYNDKPWSMIIPFNDIPDDLSILFDR